jgi:hypothetical protein
MNDQRPAFGEVFNPYRQFRTGVWVPAGIMQYKGLSAGAKLLYGQLLRHAGQNGKCFPTKKHLAAVLGCDERTIQRYLGELAAHHHGYPFIRREQSRPGISPNDYGFVRHPLLEGETDLSPLWESRLSPQGRQDRLPQESNRKSSSTREKQTSALPLASGVVTRRQGPHATGRADGQKRTVATDLPTPIISDSLDDDEQGIPRRERHPNPESELLLRLKERHPNADNQYILAEVKKALAKTGVSMVDYLTEDEKRTTNPGALNRIPGYYVGMVKTITADARRVALECLFAVPARTPSSREDVRPAPDLCPECKCQKGRGLKFENTSITFCGCATKEFRVEHETKERERLQRQADVKRAREQAASEIAPEAKPLVIANTTSLLRPQGLSLGTPFLSEVPLRRDLSGHPAPCARQAMRNRYYITQSGRALAEDRKEQAKCKIK